MDRTTPRPWHLGKNGDKCAKDHAICSGPITISKVYGGGYPAGEGWSPRSAADAELIVRAVNSFDAMREALRDCVESLSRLPDVEGAYRVTCLGQAKDALKLAEGEKQEVAK